MSKVSGLEHDEVALIMLTIEPMMVNNFEHTVQSPSNTWFF